MTLQTLLAEELSRFNRTINAHITLPLIPLVFIAKTSRQLFSIPQGTDVLVIAMHNGLTDPITNYRIVYLLNEHTKTEFIGTLDGIDITGVWEQARIEQFSGLSTEDLRAELQYRDSLAKLEAKNASK